MENNAMNKILFVDILVNIFVDCNMYEVNDSVSRFDHQNLSLFSHKFLENIL